MAETLDELMVRIDANVTGLLNGMSQATNSAEKTSKGIQGSLDKIGGSFNKVAGLALGFAAVIGIKVGVDAFKHFVAGAFESVGAMIDLSDQLGIGIEKLYGMKVAAADTGVAFEKVTLGVTVMSRKISEAATGSFEANRAFRDLGLSAKELSQLTPDEAMGRIADAANNVSNKMDKARILTDLFGKSGAQLNNFLVQGSAGMKAAAEEAAALGLSLSKLDARKVDVAGDSFGKLKLVLEGVGNTLAVELAPFVLKISEYLLAAAKESGGFKSAIKSAVDIAIEGVKFIVDGWKSIGMVINTVKGSFWAFSEAVNFIYKKQAQGWVALGQLLSNFGKAMWETAKTGQSGFEVAWAAIKYAFDVMVTKLGTSFSNLLHTWAETTSRIAPDLSKKFSDAANFISTSTGGMAATASDNLKKISEAAADQSQKMRDSWKNILNIDTSNNGLVKFFEEGEAKAKTFKEEAFAAVIKSIDSPWPSEAVTQWADTAVEEINRVAAAQEKALSGGGGTAKDDEKQKRLDNNLVAFTEYLDAETLLENENTEERKQAAEELFENGKINEMQKNAILEGIEADHQQRLRDIEAKSITDRKGMFTKELQNRVATAGAMFGQLATLAQSGNKRLIAIGKAARVAETIMNTASAAMAGWNQGMQQGGPYLGAAYAAIAIAAGAVQLSTINSVNSGGGGSIGGVGGSGNVAASSGNGNNGVSNKQDTPQMLNVTISDESLGKNAVMALGRQLHRAVTEDGLVIGGISVNGG